MHTHQVLCCTSYINAKQSCNFQKYYLKKETTFISKRAKIWKPKFLVKAIAFDKNTRQNNLMRQIYFESCRETLQYNWWTHNYEKSVPALLEVFFFSKFQYSIKTEKYNKI